MDVSTCASNDENKKSDAPALVLGKFKSGAMRQMNLKGKGWGDAMVKQHEVIDVGMSV